MFSCVLRLGVQCPLPEEPAFGSVIWEHRNPGSIMHYTCNDGFTLVGAASLVCLTSGEWNDSSPMCYKKGILYEKFHEFM